MSSETCNRNDVDCVVIAPPFEKTTNRETPTFPLLHLLICVAASADIPCGGGGGDG
jgi:hypothetical protein